MKNIITFKDFVNENVNNDAYEIIVNRKNTETIYNSDIEDLMDDGYDNIQSIVDNYLIQMGYKQRQMEDWHWSNPNDLKQIKKTFKLKD